MSEPRVWNRRRATEIPVGAVYVGRPTPWGNPFVIGRDGTREEVIEKYRRWLNAGPGRRRLAQAQAELRGKDLVCWCAPAPCHADVLLEAANA